MLHWDCKNNVGVIVPKSALWRHFSPKEGKVRHQSRRSGYRVQGYEGWRPSKQMGKEQSNVLMP